MPTPSPTFIDRATQEIYYLGFDLLLVRAPIRDDIAYTRDARTVLPTPDDPALSARHAAIRTALIAALVDDSPAWAPVLDEARSRANELADAAGLPVPAPIPADRIVTRNIDTEIRIPPERLD